MVVHIVSAVPHIIRGAIHTKGSVLCKALLSKTTHFGFETVPEAEKAGKVQNVFTSVASKYDIMNDIMSVGIHRIWKEAMMDWLAPRPGQRLLDVAGGTGDISFKIPEACWFLGMPLCLI